MKARVLHGDGPGGRQLRSGKGDARQRRNRIHAHRTALPPVGATTPAETQAELRVGQDEGKERAVQDHRGEKLPS